MAENGTGNDPVDMLVRSTRDLLRPEELVREATRDIVKEEIRRHLEHTLKSNPDLDRDLRAAIKALLEARAQEYAALLRVGACTARLGLAAVPAEIRQQLTRDVIDLFSRELGQIVERSL
jgi:hypothetical protein